ncbi:hypothetical protein SMAC4_05389 [Sordaria macrospora]|uniref:uncharacterized protein n=1 Tax=Sordaria macrospora TaxID=5147 RepID=UPI001DD34197|nr:kinase-like domain-containing protein [Sordaria sp. MPI-SDFR-AT-0083]WPJ57620.1 hypothetical protein SMAC4_05389 [Sordaria macrospora]
MAASVLAAAPAATQTSLEDHSHASHSEPNLSRTQPSPRQYPTDSTSTIPEEGDETESDATNEPVTPVSGRQSQDFHESLVASEAHPSDDDDVIYGSIVTSGKPRASFSAASAVSSKSTLNLNSHYTPAPRKNSIAESTATTTGRRSNTFKRAMSGIFRRTASTLERSVPGLMDHHGDSAVLDPHPHDMTQPRDIPGRRFSLARSSNTTRSNTPPSPGSPLEMNIMSKEQASSPTVPSPDAFFDKKKRATTGLGLRSRAINFITNNASHDEAKHMRRPLRRRASSFDTTKREKSAKSSAAHPQVEMSRAPWEIPAPTGTGLKARRLSLSLPDDFTVDVVDLLSEFEYHNKLLRRHATIGKGGSAKVTLVSRKGQPDEIYAVKQFRAKSSSETTEEYRKKILSEYTVSKSLHHPNIVETIRLCTHHGLYSHVMEYCSEGDLFSLVQKKYLMSEDREKDRQCLFKQLVQAVNYLHSNGIAHRDIKLENILITSDSKLKLADFGVSEVFSGRHPGEREAGGQCGQGMGEVRRCAGGYLGSLPYVPPEILEKVADYDPRAVDVWGVAVCMLAMTFGGSIWNQATLTPSDGSKPDVCYVQLAEGWRKWNAKHAGQTDPVPADTDMPRAKFMDFAVTHNGLRRLLLQMLNPNPDKRISITDVFNSRFVKNIECCQLESYEDPSKTIDASKKGCSGKGAPQKIFCHNHLPPKGHHIAAVIGRT